MAGLSLDGKRLLITGVLTKGSIAYTVAERAQQEGAQVVLTGFGRTRRMTERAASRLPESPDVLELDVNSPDDLAALTGELRDRWGGIDGALHAIAFAPGDALGGNFMSAPPESAELAFRTSAYSFKALAEALAPLMDDGGSLVGMDFDATKAWPIYDWMGVAKAALESVSRYLARDLGEQHVRPGRDPGRAGHPGLRDARRPLGRPGPARLGHDRPRARRRRGPLPPLGPRPRDHRRDPPRGRRLPRNGRAHPPLERRH
jgi:enoyl-[acyl-carrier-protein] reductase (NADH)